MTTTKKSLIDDVEDDAIKSVLLQPIGTPVKLNREQAMAVAAAGIGGRPDLPTGSEYVKRLRTH